MPLDDSQPTSALPSPSDGGDATYALLDPIVAEARKRLERCQEFESESRRRFLEDLKFRHGDSDNGYQWPNAIKNSRDIDQRPCLTMNIVRQHNLMIVNEAARNKSSIKIMGTGGGASAESANIFKWLIRHIEYQSTAQDAYEVARNFQVDGGIGHWRIVTRYETPETFDQEIYIVPVPDPLSIFYDPDAKQADKSDGRFAFVFDIVPKEEFRDAYPELIDLIGEQPLGTGSTGGDWLPKDHIMVAEYFRKVEIKDELVGFVGQDGVRRALLKSKMPQDVYDGLVADTTTRRRDTWTQQIEWFLIIGDRIVDQVIWPGKYIPLIPVIGEETLIEGLMDRKGHTRAMKDAQRMYNYNASSQTEFVALQTKVPWLAASKAIENFQGYWNTANTINHSYLPFNHYDESNPEMPIPPPQRLEPPNFAPGFESGMQTAFNQMMMTSGQYQNQMGMQGNERTGKAIQERQEQSDTSTYHFQNNYGRALRNTGKQLIDLIPKVYDTKRIRRLTNDEGDEIDVEIDPAQAQALQVLQDHQGQVIRRIFNPGVGMYDVAADVGPAQGTKRQEVVEQLGMFLTQAPALTAVIGDLLLKNMDFDEAQEAARRLRRMVPPQALGQGPSQSEQALQMQIASLQGALTKALQRAGADRIKLMGKNQMRDIEVYEAETDRIKALAGMLPTDEGGLATMIDQLVKDTLATHLLPILEANQGGVQEESGGTAGPSAASPPMEGAQQAPDGEWYLQDPTRQGKYMRVVPLAQMRKPKGVIENA